MLAPFNTEWTSNIDMLEIDNHYYVFTYGLNGDRSEVENDNDLEDVGIVTIYDEDFNQLNQIQLSVNGITISPRKVFYEQDTFYAFGFCRVPNYLGIGTNCFAKFDKNFNATQPITLFYVPDSIGRNMDVMKTKSNEFLFQLYMEDSNRLLLINSNGEILQDILIGIIGWATILETDSNYMMTLWGSAIGVFDKDSLNKYEVIRNEILLYSDRAEEPSAVTVNNQIIRAYIRMGPHNNCPSKPSKEVWNEDNSILFLDDSFKIKHLLLLGDPCVDDLSGRDNMHYLNPDSIYYAYRTFSESAHDFWDYTGNTISIANFSWDGKLNFDHTLDLPVDSGTCRYIHFCRALSNGGVLIGGQEGDFIGFFRKSFLLYYHPTREVSNVKQVDVAGSGLRVYPNPTNGTLQVTGYELQEHTLIEIYDVVGKLYIPLTPFKGGMSSAANSPFEGGRGMSEITIDVSHLANGLYFLKIDGKTVKFVKE